jgi:steroid 5-alpha reductase family enzyme
MHKLKENRAASFVTLALVYILATIVGIATYQAISAPWWLSLLLADVMATIVTFLFSLIFGNASVYDPYWSVQPPVILVAFAVGKRLTAFGVLLLIVVGYWALRLTANWAYTFHGLMHQDWRYTMLHEKTGMFYPIINFVGIHMVPTLVVYACILPAVFAIREGLHGNIGSFLFLLLSVGAATMQGIADIQMHTFRKHRTSTFIRIGLWKYSRHPNYLGEILMWWGVGLSVVLAAPHMWPLLLGALLNTALFLFVSIPMADGRQSRKEGFSAYKAETRMLLPIRK